MPPALVINTRAKPGSGATWAASAIDNRAIIGAQIPRALRCGAPVRAVTKASGGKGGGIRAAYSGWQSFAGLGFARPNRALTCTAWALSSVGRAPPLQGEGRGIEARSAHAGVCEPTQVFVMRCSAHNPRSHNRRLVVFLRRRLIGLSSGTTTAPVLALRNPRARPAVLPSSREFVGLLFTL